VLLDHARVGVTEVLSNDEWRDAAGAPERRSACRAGGRGSLPLERARNPVEVRMKLRTTPTQPAAARGDQAARTDDFIDSIDPKRTFLDAAPRGGLNDVLVAPRP
jgi:hypothetical protein